MGVLCRPVGPGVHTPWNPVSLPGGPSPLPALVWGSVEAAGVARCPVSAVSSLHQQPSVLLTASRVFAVCSKASSRDRCLTVLVPSPGLCRGVAQGGGRVTVLKWVS